MIEIQTILVPTDFSDCASVAVRYAKQMAEKFNSRIHLLYVIPDSSLVLPEAIVPAVTQIPDITEMQKSAGEGLHKVVEEFGLENFQVTFESRLGSPADEIIGAAKDSSANLIVIGTHGRGAIAHFLLGSVAEQVVRHAPCPVLTVRIPSTT
ncbi:MAG: universal stress protein [Gemmataceae bacterium]